MILVRHNDREYLCLQPSKNDNDYGVWLYRYEGEWHKVVNYQIRYQLNKLLNVTPLQNDVTLCEHCTGLCTKAKNVIVKQKNNREMTQQLQKNEDVKQIEAFQFFLNTEPERSAILVNKEAKNSNYLPIQFLENKLDEVYSGLWSVSEFKYQTIANEVIGSLVLKVFHPVAHVWIERTGAAGKPITFKAGSEISDINNKQKNAMVTVMPALKAECLKNACKSLGVVFGRNLNRAEEDYTPISEQLETYTENQNKAFELLNTATKIPENARAGMKDKITKASPKKVEEIISYLEGQQ